MAPKHGFGMSRSSSLNPHNAAGKTPELSGLPPDLVIRIISFLPVPDLKTVACASRRLKILAYNDDVYEHKLRVLGVLSATDINTGPTSGANAPTQEEEAEAAAVNKLSVKLKQLPGGNLLPAGTKYLETGTLWGGLNQPRDEELISFSPEPKENGSGSDDDKSSGDSKKEDGAGAGSSKEGEPAETTGDTSSSTTTSNSTTSTTATTQKITAGLPQQSQLKKSALTIGAGGLKAANRSNSNLTIGAMKKDRQTVSQRLKGVRPREAFKNIYIDLCPYYLDFKSHQQDSKVFKEGKDLIETATLLRRLRLFSKAKFITNMDEVNFALETTIEWFESMILGQFEKAYDNKNIAEMKRNATAAYELNGGSACVQLFISKNPIFFDHTFNPSLVASKLPSPEANGGNPAGYALADEFAKFMDHTLTSCRTQATLVGKVFNPEMDAMTAFVSKVFEDSINEYLAAVLKTAKEREGVGIYLHTLATSVHCCIQFLEYISTAEMGVAVHTEKIKESIAAVFKPFTDGYMQMELDFMSKKFDTELAKWNNRKDRGKKKNLAYLADAEKTQAHKRQVMSVMKSVIFAPVAIGKSLMGGGKNKAQTQALLEDADLDLDGNSNSPRDDNVTYYLDDGDSMGSLVSLELCLHLMHTNKESLGRCLVITSIMDMSLIRPNVSKVFIKCLEAVGTRHMSPAFNKAINRLSNSTPIDNWTDGSSVAVNMDSLQFFELIHIADLIHQMVDVYFAEDIKPWIDEYDFLSDIMVEKKSFDRMSDDNVAGGMDKAIQVLINQLDHILCKGQDPADYNPPANKNVYDLKATATCKTAIACLNSHVKLLQGVANKDTLEVFFGELGIRFFHDLNSYYEWALSLRVSAVARLFLVLKEVGNLFLADGSVELKNMVHDAERYQGVLRLEEIYELMQARTDYKKIQKYVESKECIIQ
ncbi:F-box protein: endocytic membrane traffic, recycling ReCYcling 1 [Chytridiales sp. JEL 0842]|nr:F-box protein: endocytic membrane traffic, recycling ReCYcling 1 [Chytridiales sp. JEL 0842]